MANRSKGEGSIRQRKDGLWEARYTVGRDAEGKLIRKSIYNKSRTEVSKQLTKILNTINSGTFVEPTKMTVSDWMNTWLKEYKYPSVKLSTYSSYTHTFKDYIEPAIGHMLLKNLRPDHVQYMLNDLKKKEYSSRTIKYTHIILNGALKQALVNNSVVRNVCEAVQIPKGKLKKEIRVLSKEEQKTFLEAIKGEYYEVAFLLTLATGLRRGELLALTWENVDLKENVIKVTQTMSRLKDPEKEKSSLVFTSPKTKKSKRNIPLLKSVSEKLKQYKKNQYEKKLMMDVEYNPKNLVFCSIVGTPVEPTTFDRAFRRILKACDIQNVNFHALRHTFATRGLENGIELKVMQEILGHSSITLTADIYSHVLPDKKREAIEKLNDLF